MRFFFFVQSQLNVSAQGIEYNGVLMRGNGGKLEYIPILSAVARVRPLHFKILHNEIVSSKVLLIGSYVAMTRLID